MKNLLIAFVFVVGFQTVVAQDTISDAEKSELLLKSPFNSLYPTSILKSSDQYFASQMELFSKGAINEKNAHLIALGTSAATKCAYCIPISYFLKQEDLALQMRKLKLQFLLQQMSCE